MNISGMMNVLGTSVLYFNSVSESLCFTCTCLDSALKRRCDSVPGCSRCYNPNKLCAGTSIIFIRLLDQVRNTSCDFFICSKQSFRNA